MAERERFWSKVDKTDSCWVWKAALTQYGYGIFRIGGRDGFNIGAHRYAYKEMFGSIPGGLDLDHLCRNRKCVNPAHLEPVTRQENVLRGVSPAARQAKQTHCIHGHELMGANLYLRNDGRRGCRTCRAAAMKRLQATDYFRTYSRERRTGSKRGSAK